MKKSLLFAGMLFATSSIAQNYVTSSSTGTEEAYDIATAGTDVLSVPAIDVLSTWRTIPFSFDFYGAPVTGYFVSDNGYITFDMGASISDPNNVALPNPSGPNNAIYAFWDALDVISGSGTADRVKTFTYGTAPNRVHVIQWYSVTPTGASTFLYSAIRLYECGDFDVVLNYGNATGMSGTIGCENATGTAGTQVSGSPSMSYPSLSIDQSDDKVYHFHWDQIGYDLSVTSVSPSNMAVVGNNTITGTIKNNGANSITSFDLNYSIDGGAAQTVTINAVIPPYGGSFNFSHGTPWNVTTGGTTHNLCVWADNINGTNSDDRSCNDEKCNSVFTSTGNSGVRTVLVEEFTGAWCGYCPDGALILDDILASYPNDAVGVSIHDGDGMTFNDGIRSGFSVTAYPTGMVDRKVFAGESKEPHSRSNWKPNTISQIGSYTPANVSMSHTYNPANREIVITVTGDFVDYANGDMRFVAMVVEDDVTGTGSAYDQVNYYNTTTGHPYEGAGNPIVGFVHNHVLRALPGGAFGNAGVVPSTVSPSSQYSESFTYTLPASFDEENIYLIGFMAYYSGSVGQREVIDAAQQPLAFNGTGLDEMAVVNNLTIYPNPGNGIVNIDFELQNAVDGRVAIFDVYGNLVDQIAEQDFTAGNQHFTYNTAKLAEGIYFVSVITDGKTYTQRLSIVR